MSTLLDGEQIQDQVLDKKVDAKNPGVTLCIWWHSWQLHRNGAYDVGHSASLVCSVPLQAGTLQMYLLQDSSLKIHPS